MAFRNIMVENPAHISVQNNRLIIRTDKEHPIAIEDISSLLLESRQSTITTAALSQLGQCGCTVFFCDEKHLPCAVLTPFQQHSRGMSVLKTQLEVNEPRKKQLWKEIVKVKIQNQAICLQLAEKAESAAPLLAMADSVRSGDSGNVEATAAQYYFRSLFGDGFTRGNTCGWNAGLNYGYAILRGAVARTLATYGFLPSLGLHHRSSLNPFNLADDLMEPFRPLIDLLVIREVQEDDILLPKHKRMLFNCLNLDILSGEQHHSVSYAIEREIQSLANALNEKSVNLTLPHLLGTDQHRYE